MHVPNEPMRLPNHDQAVIEDSKLRDYALNPRNERGQHKARVFGSALGFDLTNWEQLKQAILDTLRHHEATMISETPFGRKYTVALPVTGANGRTVDVMTIWQFDRLANGSFSEVPRLVTLYVL